MKAWEMIKALSEDPKRKAKTREGGNILQWNDGYLQWTSGPLITITMEILGYEWEIIESKPELEFVDFTEAYRQYRKYKIIKSVVTDRLYLFPDKLMSFVPVNEVDGKWIILN
jgi:hypothetical protein